MWIFTAEGLYSIEAARAGLTSGMTTLFVRSRFREHLNTLKDRFPEELGEAEVREVSLPGWPWFLMVEKDVWARCMTELVLEVDYWNLPGTLEGGKYAHLVSNLEEVMNLPQEDVWSWASKRAHKAERFLSPSDYARERGVSRDTVYRWIRNGKLPAERTPGGEWRIQI